jgi:damage-control phosphatase, subfamily III
MFKTLFSTGPLAGLFPILSLRTLKADVVVGVTEDRAKALDAEDPKWRINGK